MKPKTVPKTEYTETAVYAGRRLCVDGKVRQLFILQNGKEMFFRGIKRIWLGYTYRCGKDSIAIKPERLDADRVDNSEWEAADALIDEANARKRAEAKVAAKSKPALKAAIAALTPLTKGLDYFEREALVKWLARETGNKVRK